MILGFCYTILIGWASNEPLSPQSFEALQSAKKRCVVHYPQSPCLVKFIRKEEGRYHAICGKNREHL